MKRHTGIGVMTGTSLDGVDLVCCTFAESKKGWTWQLDASACMAIPQKLRNELASLRSGSAVDLARLDAAFGKFLGECIRSFVNKHSLRPQFAASHGQTIFHQPHRGFTSQIGDGEVIAATCGLPVVSRFRNKDVALGGQGAPLVPFGELHLFPGHKLFLNLGGISNLSAGGRAWDVAPCNLVSNAFAQLWGQKMDRGGKLAARGKVNEALLRKLNALAYYRQAPPKSLGAEWIAEKMMPVLLGMGLNPGDCLRTFIEHVAVQVGRSVEASGVKRGDMLVTGGGARNSFLMERIAAHLEGCGIRPAVADGEVTDFKEAIIFAFLGLMRLLGRPNTLPRVTGASRAACAGMLSLPN